VFVGVNVGVFVGVFVGVPTAWHAVTVTLSIRQPSPD
jgi:hypothetical protein